jgi:dynein heavy chain, axonemal
MSPAFCNPSKFTPQSPSTELFNESIDASRDPASPAADVNERCKIINYFHTLSVYKYTCLGLFERHKLLFSLLLCIRIMMNDKKIDMEEMNFVYYGSNVTDRSSQKAMPPWLDQVAWDNISELDKIPSCNGLVDSVISSGKDWNEWFMSSKVCGWGVYCCDFLLLPVAFCCS